MGMITEFEARQRFAAYVTPLRRIIFGAWSDWQLSTLAGTSRFARTRANVVWEQIVGRAHSEFFEDPRIRITRKSESCLFLLDEAVLFRFKKGDPAGSTANVPTQAQWDFHDPEQDLPGLPEIARVDVVYVLNALETAIADVVIVGRNRQKVEWMFSLLEGNEPLALPVTPISPDQDAGGQKRRLRLVHPKVDSKHKDKDADGAA
jgi:hypothetical protein